MQGQYNFPTSLAILNVLRISELQPRKEIQQDSQMLDGYLYANKLGTDFHINVLYLQHVLLTVFRRRIFDRTFNFSRTKCK